jgi:hypothetical protein
VKNRHTGASYGGRGDVNTAKVSVDGVHPGTLPERKASISSASVVSTNAFVPAWWNSTTVARGSSTSWRAQGA